MNKLKKAFQDLGEAMKAHEKRFTFGHDIQFPVKINGIIFRKFHAHPSSLKPGSVVAIRPCAEKYEKKTFLGFYVGDLPLEYLYELEKDTGIMHVIPIANPAIFVFDLGKIVWGCESWWGPIESEDQLRQITDNDIKNIWYVKALKQLNESGQHISG